MIQDMKTLENNIVDMHWAITRRDRARQVDCRGIQSSARWYPGYLDRGAMSRPPNGSPRRIAPGATLASFFRGIASFGGQSRQRTFASTLLLSR